ncbi:carbonic anhydrase 3-like [Vanessa atalanta]|uniref:carbonic anhydrase 3-like n=1 Tax=Vanessa atalanta TaxID=42275 RepID=UPI001FCDB465|nr:carbonic anhydrase 3-like [Vanessa atalanta]
MLRIVIIKSLFVIFIVLFANARKVSTSGTQDQTTTRPNTLNDDADDIQRQLDNEARDKMVYGKPKTVWIFRLPTQFPLGTTKSLSRNSRKLKIFQNRAKPKTNLPDNSTLIPNEWCYKNQNEWYKKYPHCGRHSQSPVDLPAVRVLKVKGSRNLCFINYDVIPRHLTLNKSGQRVILYGEWEQERQPLVYGGAAHSRRYVFHSMILHWPSEHRIGGFQYPMESQVIHISAEFKSLDEALAASLRDPQAVLGIANLYKYKNYTQQGLAKLLNVAYKSRGINASVTPLYLSYFNPPLKQYACYQGSLTVPPCTESVLWMVRGTALSVTREDVEIANSLLDDGGARGSLVRQPQPLNDRKVFYFK